MGVTKGGNMTKKINIDFIEVPKKRESNLVRCPFKEELDRYCNITKRDRTIALQFAWDCFKETDFYKRDMLGLKVK